jgi:HAMP domain-containing protein
MLDAFSVKDLQTAKNVWLQLQKYHLTFDEVDKYLVRKPLTAKMSKKEVAELTPEERKLRQQMKRAMWATESSGRIRP